MQECAPLIWLRALGFSASPDDRYVAAFGGHRPYDVPLQESSFHDRLQEYLFLSRIIGPLCRILHYVVVGETRRMLSPIRRVSGRRKFFSISSISFPAKGPFFELRGDLPSREPFYGLVSADKVVLRVDYYLPFFLHFFPDVHVLAAPDDLSVPRLLPVAYHIAVIAG